MATLTTQTVPNDASLDSIADRQGREHLQSSHGPSDVVEDDGWMLIDDGEVPTDLVQPRSNVYLDFQLKITSSVLSSERQPGPTEEDTVVAGNERVISLQEQSPLFQLPAEIRLRIYEDLLRIPTSRPGVGLVRALRPGCPPSVLSILLTCRRALAEAEETFYSINRICTEPSQLLASLGDRRLCAITSFTLIAPSSGSALIGLQYLQQLPNLTSLYMLRVTSVKYIDVLSWAMLTTQLASELGKMEKLVDFMILTPPATNLTEHDMARQSKLANLDQRLYNAVSSSSETGLCPDR